MMSVFVCRLWELGGAHHLVALLFCRWQHKRVHFLLLVQIYNVPFLQWLNRSELCPQSTRGAWKLQVEAEAEARHIAHKGTFESWEKGFIVDLRTQIFTSWRIMSTDCFWFQPSGKDTGSIVCCFDGRNDSSKIRISDWLSTSAFIIASMINVSAGSS